MESAALHTLRAGRISQLEGSCWVGYGEGCWQRELKRAKLAATFPKGGASDPGLCTLHLSVLYTVTPSHICKGSVWLVMCPSPTSGTPVPSNHACSMGSTPCPLLKPCLYLHSAQEGMYCQMPNCGGGHWGTLKTMMSWAPAPGNTSQLC